MRLVTLLFVVIVSAILGSFILGENPGKYSLGFLLVLFLGYAFISHLLYFMVGLFFLRPAIDIFLLSVRFAPGGVDLGLGGVIGLALVVGALLRALIFQKDAFKLGNGAVGLYFIFCVLSLIPFFFADDKIGSAKVMLRYFSCLAILVLTLLSIHNEKDARLLMRGMLFSVIIPIIYGFYNYFIQKGRFMGTFTHPNILAFFLLIMIGCIFFQVDQPGGFVRKFSARRILALIVLLIILVLTETRSGWVAFFIMSMMYCFFFYRKLILPALLIFVVLGMTPFVQKKITNVLGLKRGAMFNVEVHKSRIELIPVEVKEISFSVEQYKKLDKLSKDEKGQEKKVSSTMIQRMKKGRA